MADRILPYALAASVIHAPLDCPWRLRDHHVQLDVVGRRDGHGARRIGSRLLGGHGHRAGLHRPTRHQTHPSPPQHAGRSAAILGPRQVAHGRGLGPRMGGLHLDSLGRVGLGAAHASGGARRGGRGFPGLRGGAWLGRRTSKGCVGENSLDRCGVGNRHHAPPRAGLGRRPVDSTACVHRRADPALRHSGPRCRQAPHGDVALGHVP